MRRLARIVVLMVVVLTVASPVAARSARARALRLGLGTRAAASLLLSGHPKPAWVRAAGKGAHPRTLLFPVRGGVFGRGFGDGEDGGHLAVDISAPMRTRVRAAAGGIVGYAGDGVSGYGNLVLIVHPGGWVTLYGHNDSLLVRAGQRVSRGQPVARLGQTGIARGPHLHFELAVDGRLCDPSPLMRPLPARRNGKSAVTRPLAWLGGPVPEGLRCEPRSGKSGSKGPTRTDPADAGPAGE
ncbi:MAG: M23 family metallopeptidase [Deltaproteobacteria bacterium]|nr:M23 family metallopeptidase [Deltaproteobacteria bacterium]